MTVQNVGILGWQDEMIGHYQNKTTKKHSTREGRGGSVCKLQKDPSTTEQIISNQNEQRNSDYNISPAKDS